MKKLLLLLMVLAGLGWGIREGAQRALPVWLADMVSVHGPAITRTATDVARAQFDLPTRQLRYEELRVAGVRNYPATLGALDAESVVVQMPPDFALDFSRPSLLPPVQAVDSVTLDGVTLYYDIDSEGGNLRQLRLRISDAAAEGMRQRLNARNRGEEAAAASPQRVIVNALALTGIQVRARSVDNQDRQKTFLVGDIRMRDIGKATEGATWPEVIDLVSRRLVDDIHREALLQGVIEPPRVEIVTPGRDATRRPARSTRSDGTAADETAGDTSGDSSGNGNGTIKDIGQGVKKIGREFGKGIRRVFGKEE